MRTLLEEYNAIIKEHPEWWNYYGGTWTGPYPKDKNGATDFIMAYFKAGEKASAINRVVDRNAICRAEHMVSAFFLGILLYDKSTKIHDALNQKIKELKIPQSEWPNGYEEESEEKLFLYIWFLTCLYHDAGYKAEEQHDDLNTEIEHILSMLRFSKRAIPNKLFNNSKLYYELRKLGRINPHGPKIDHGIIGGCMLYSNMAKLHNKKELFREDGGGGGVNLY